MKTQEIYNKLIEEISLNSHVRLGNGHCTWTIKGNFTDRDGNRQEVSATTHDEELATGWKEDQYDRALYTEFQRKWAEFLVDSLDLVNAY